VRTETDKEAILGMVSELYQRVVESDVDKATLNEVDHTIASAVILADPGDCIIGDYGSVITLRVRMK